MTERTPPSDIGVLDPATVKKLRDAGPNDLVWLLCDSHEALRATLSLLWTYYLLPISGDQRQQVLDALGVES